MKLMKFNSNTRMTLGVEHEVQFINRSNGCLMPIAQDVLRVLSEHGCDGRITSEIFQSMIEVRTGVCDNAFEVFDQLQELHLNLEMVANSFGAGILSTGTHPFEKYDDRKLFPSKRYEKLILENQWIAKRLLIFGVHVHVGMPDGETAIAVSNQLQRYIPLLLALSANSPFFENRNVGLASSRSTIFESKPTGGHPVIFKSWTEFKDVIDALKKSSSISTLKDLWWDVRLNNDFGTIEVRIFDSPLRLQNVAAFAALVQSICELIVKSPLSHSKIPRDWMIRENKWRAARYGMDSSILVDSKGNTQDLWTFFRQTVNDIEQSRVRLDYLPLWEFLFNYKNDFKAQLSFDETKDRVHVVQESSRVFAESVRQNIF